MSCRNRLRVVHSSAYFSGSSPYVWRMYPFSGATQSISLVCFRGQDIIGACTILTVGGGVDKWQEGVCHMYEESAVMIVEDIGARERYTFDNAGLKAMRVCRGGMVDGGRRQS